MKVKISVLLLALIVSFAAFAESLKLVNLTDLSDDILSARGSFSLASDAAEAVKDAFKEKTGTYTAGGVWAFDVITEGNSLTGVTYSVLEIFYAGAKTVKPTAVSVAVGDIRYDFTCGYETISTGKSTCERVVVFLDETGLEMLEALRNVKACSIALYGDGMITRSFTVSDVFGNELAAASFKALEVTGGFTDAGAEKTENAFSEKYSVVPESDKRAIMSFDGFTFDKSMGVVTADFNSVKALGQLLIEKGYMAGIPGTSVTDSLKNAVKRAQKACGMIPTAYADAALIDALTNGFETAAVNENNLNGKEASLGKLKLSFNSAYAARAFAYKGGIRTVSDSDNVFIYVECTAVNEETENVSLGWELTATLTYDSNYVFPASIYAVTDGGAMLSTTLGMLSEKTMIIACEVPARIAENTAVLTLTYKTQTVTLDIE